MQTIYTLLLYLYPPAFRRVHGREMLQHLRALRSSSLTDVQIACHLFADLVRSVPREWRAALEKDSSGGLLSLPPARRPGEPMKNLAGDVRFATRLLIKNPAFTVPAVLTLALGIGANTAIFGLAEATLLRPLKVANPEQLRAWPWSSSYPDYREFEQRTDVFAGLAAVSGARLNLSIDGVTDLRTAAFVSGNTFSVLGVPAALGRQLLPSDDRGPGNAVVGVLAYDYWRSRFGSEPAAVGRVVRANGTPITIVGVAAEGFRGTSLFSNPALFLPLTSVTQVRTGFFSRPAVLEHRGLVWLTAFGRLRRDVTEAQATGEMDAHYRRLHPPAPGDRDFERLTFVPLTTLAMGGDRAMDARRFVLMLMGIVGLTLLIGCANLANLLLARAAARRREIAVRRALGASRGRIVRQMLVEHVLLAALGGAAGVYVAHIAFKLLEAYQLPGGIDIDNLGLSIDRVALAATAALSVLTGLLFGVAPAWRASRAEILPALREESRSASGTTRPRGALVAAQVALSLVLLAGAGLFLRSLVHALDMPLGFDVEGVATASVNLGFARYDEPRAKTFYDEALERVRALPGVTAASWSTLIPTNGDMTGTVAEIEGYVKQPQEVVELHVPRVGPDYFRAAGIRMLSGRPFLPSDDPGGPGVVVISRAAAEKYWAGRDPVGGRLRMSEKGEWFTVVGVSENTIVADLGERPAPFAYFPFDRTMEGFATVLDANHLLVRTTRGVPQLLPMIRDQLRAIDSEVPVYDVQPFAVHVQDLVMPQRMGVTLFSFFSLLALSLATVGIYGVASYVAALRKREIGIRIALGADAGEIRRLVLVQGAAPVGAGIVVGLVLALWAARLASGFIIEVTPSDPLTFGVVTAVMTALALIASYLPARRAAHIDPVEALRND